MSFAMKGAVDLGSLTGIVTTRKALGTNPASPAPTDIVTYGAQTIPLKTAVNLGLADRAADGTYTSLQTAQTPTRVDA